MFAYPTWCIKIKPSTWLLSSPSELHYLWCLCNSPSISSEGQLPVSWKQELFKSTNQGKIPILHCAVTWTFSSRGREQQNGQSAHQWTPKQICCFCFFQSRISYNCLKSIFLSGLFKLRETPRCCQCHQPRAGRCCCGFWVLPLGSFSALTLLPCTPQTKLSR